MMDYLNIFVGLEFCNIKLSVEKIDFVKYVQKMKLLMSFIIFLFVMIQLYPKQEFLIYNCIFFRNPNV